MLVASSDKTEIDAGLQDTTVSDASKIDNVKNPTHKKDWRFWSIIACLSITALLASIDGTIITTSLPSIVNDLSGGDKYVWVVGSYFLARYVSVPTRTSWHTPMYEN